MDSNQDKPSFSFHCQLMNKKFLNYFLLDQLQLSHSVFLTVYTSVGYLHMIDVLSLVLLLENLHVNKSLSFSQVGLFCHHTIMTFLQIARHSIGEKALHIAAKGDNLAKFYPAAAFKIRWGGTGKCIEI